jgi:hypothetical protein
MKKMLLSMALAVVAPFAWGQVSETTTTTTTTEGNGTITQFTPRSEIVLRESSGPLDLSLRQNGHLCDEKRQDPR